MNKIIRICMVLMLAMSIAACGSKEPAAQQNEKQGETQIPNPWIDCGTLEEAAQIAGFDMTVPDRIDGYPNTTIQAMDKSVIQVFYSDKALGEEGCKTVLIRKGLGEEDISGDYNEYKENTTAQMRDAEVSLRGDGGLVYTATWIRDGYSYSISADDGMSAEQIEELVEIIK